MPRDTTNYLEVRPRAVLDTECYSNYWSIGFKNIDTGKVVIYEKFVIDGQEIVTFDPENLKTILKKYRVYTFNGISYDIPMIMLALSGASCATLKKANDLMIGKRVPWWEMLKRFDLPHPPDWLDHVDMFHVTPGVKLSLKKYGARMNMRWLQELPFDFTKPIRKEDRPMMVRYLRNDLDTTAELVVRMPEEVKLREELSAKYKIDVRSKSDAQIASTLLPAIVGEMIGEEIPKKPVVERLKFKYIPPPFIKFKTKKLQDVLRIITSVDFTVSDQPDPPDAKKGSKHYGVVRLPKAIKDIELQIGFTEYTMGLGGLHSNEHRRSFIADEDTIIEDRDVRAYYPWLMLKCGFFPGALGRAFLQVFKRFVLDRDAFKEKAKAFKKAMRMAESISYKNLSDSYKIINNGTFGNLGNPHCSLHAPKMLIHTTLTGQLSLLMLIEELEERKFSVISANTDGIVTVIPRERYGEFAAVVFDWECDTSFITEAVRYAGVYSRDVNSYVALIEGYKDHPGDPNYDAKRKGLFAKAGLQERHDPTFDICSTAVVEYLMWGKDIEQTIMACDDITQFVGIKQVQGGGSCNGEYLGGLVRWYYSVDSKRNFICKPNGARVAGTTGAMPCMDLPEDFPDDVDYDWYVREAYARLDDIGLKVRDPRLAERYGYMLASLPKQKTTHLVDLQSRRSVCERYAEKQVRQAWEEHKGGVPHGMRMCKACMEERGYVDQETSDD